MSKTPNYDAKVKAIPLQKMSRLYGDSVFVGRVVSLSRSMNEDGQIIAKALNVFRTKISDLRKQQMSILDAFSQRLSKKKIEKIRSAIESEYAGDKSTKH